MNSYKLGKQDMSDYKENSNPFKGRTFSWHRYNIGYNQMFTLMAEQCKNYNQFIDKIKDKQVRMF